VECGGKGTRLGGGPGRTWREVVQKGCRARELNGEEAMDCGGWRRLIEDG